MATLAADTGNIGYTSWSEWRCQLIYLIQNYRAWKKRYFT